MSLSRRLGLSAALVVAASVLPAAPASAHAVLLRTEPSPQTTVAMPPPAIRLHFSEAVEAAFGAIRVFDVDGRRVATGQLRRADAGREVAVPVRLRNGTYTVTWRVSSIDGHPVHGGFSFYVGAPSAISPAAVTGERDSSTLVTWGYGIVRFAWFSALLALVGMVAVRRWVWTPSVRALGLGDSAGARVFRRRFAAALPAAWLVLAAAGMATIVFQAATLSGLPLSESAGPAVVGEVLDTTFGRVWMAGLALTVVAGVGVWALVRRRPLLGLPSSFWIAVLGVAALGLCLGAALSGHARTFGTPALAVPSLAVHLLAAGVWVGGLAGLVLLGGMAWRALPAAPRPALVRHLVLRFGRLALVAVAVVVATGVVNALGGLAAVSDLWRTDYGRVVAAKVVLLGLALAMAARHHWVVPRRLAEDQGSALAVGSFRRSGLVELAVLTAAVALAAALVALVPGRSLAMAAKGPVSQQHRAGPYTVQLFIDPTGVGANQVHVTFVDPRGLAAAEVATAQVALGPLGSGLQPVPMRLISPGHFVGDADLPTPGRYRVSVSGGSATSAGSTSFSFRLHAASKPASSKETKP